MPATLLFSLFLLTISPSLIDPWLRLTLLSPEKSFLRWLQQLSIFSLLLLLLQVSYFLSFYLPSPAGRMSIGGSDNWARSRQDNPRENQSQSLNLWDIVGERVNTRDAKLDEPKFFQTNEMYNIGTICFHGNTISLGSNILLHLKSDHSISNLLPPFRDNVVEWGTCRHLTIVTWRTPHVRRHHKTFTAVKQATVSAWNNIIWSLHEDDNRHKLKNNFTLILFTYSL